MVWFSSPVSVQNVSYLDRSRSRSKLRRVEYGRVPLKNLVVRRCWPVRFDSVRGDVVLFDSDPVAFVFPILIHIETTSVASV